MVHVLLVVLAEESLGTPPHIGLVLGKGAEKKTEVLPAARKFTNYKERKDRLQRVGYNWATKHTKKEQREHLKREMGYAERGNASRGLGYRVFKGLFY